MTSNRTLTLACALASLTADVVTKALVQAHIPQGSRIDVIEHYFQLTHTRNPGFAFSLLVDAPPMLRAAVVVFVTLLVTGIAHRMLRDPTTPRRIALALGLMLGGAYGNLLDRIRFGEVIDFLRIHDHQVTLWPTFNVADITIVIGALLLILDALPGPWTRRTQANSSTA